MDGTASAVVVESAPVVIAPADITIYEGGVAYCETNLNLEDNKGIQNNWGRFENVLHKRRRSYLKKIA